MNPASDLSIAHLLPRLRPPTVDNGYIEGMIHVFIDLTKVSDTIDHSILLHKLATCIYRV